MKRVIALIFLIFTSGSIYLIFAQNTAPRFQLNDLDGESKDLKDYLGKGPIVLDFWATWCKPCIKYLPEIQKLYEKYKEHDLVVLSVNVDSPRNRSKIKPFVKSKGLTFPVLLDDNSQIMRRYQIFSIPATVLISVEGKIKQTHTGYRSGDEKKLELKIREMLELETEKDAGR
ncbi:redoxin domain-containing protein [candidate division KSB1 bacterium]|nr:redoxin domain-containing protein [candidate division KSB1 bacterium]